MPDNEVVNSKVPDALTTWVAHSHHGPTRLTEPFNIDFRARREYSSQDDLGEYHPREIARDRFELKHVHREDSAGLHVVVTDISSNWHEKFAAVMRELRFELVRNGGGSVLYLEDAVPKDDERFKMNGWHVEKWTVAKNRNANGKLVHQDIISWRKGDKLVESLLSWHPYLRQDVEVNDATPRQEIRTVVLSMS